MIKHINMYHNQEGQSSNETIMQQTMKQHYEPMSKQWESHLDELMMQFCYQNYQPFGIAEQFGL